MHGGALLQRLGRLHEPLLRLRTLTPGLALAGGLVGLGLLMDRGAGAGLPRALVEGAALGHFAILLLGPLAIHPLAFVRGGRAGERVLADLLPAAAWLAGQVALHLELGHGPTSALYLAFSLPTYLLLQLLALEMVLAEGACRLVSSRRGGTPAVRPGSRRRFLAAAGGVAAWVATDPFLLIRYFLGHQRGHRALFGRPLPEPARRPGPGPAGAPAAPRRRPPNLVVILSDDHRADALGHAGHPFLETPALDRLAREGLRMRNAFVTCSLCSPSRGSFLTGQYPHRHGVLDNGSPWSERNRTFFEPLARAGYRNAFVGKWHMPGGLPRLRGVERFVTFTVGDGQGVYHDCPLVVDGRPEPSRRRYIAEELTDRALEFVRASRSRKRPFALYLSHKNVHAPFTPDLPERGRYAEAAVPLPPEAHAFAPWTEGQQVHFLEVPMEAVMRRYAECVASMDRTIGRLLDELDAMGLAEDTVVLYTSDNGYLWGEHGHVDKRWAWDPSIRVPWLVRAPGLASPGTVSDRLVLNLDLAPTLLELAGLPVPAHVQGRSLVPLLRDPEAPFRDAFYYAYFFEPPYPVPTIEAVRTERHKLVTSRGRPPELYDLARDPAERRDLHGTQEGAALEPRLRERLRALRREAGLAGEAADRLPAG